MRSDSIKHTIANEKRNVKKKSLDIEKIVLYIVGV